MKYIAHVIDAANGAHRIEIERPDKATAIKDAIGSIKGAKGVSIRRADDERPTMPADFGEDLRMPGYPQ